MKVGMADAAIKDFDRDVVVAHVASLKVKGRE
jgi:hypothetical protein